MSDDNDGDDDDDTAPRLPPAESVDSLDDLPEDENGEYLVDFREQPQYYRVDRGEAGAFKVQPYKDELLPLWGIANREAAAEGAAAIYQRYLTYRECDAFPGMDLARKYLQMGWTRALRYAKYPGGRKYDEDGTEREPQEWYDEEKREIARIYRDYLDRVREDEPYQRLRAAHQRRVGAAGDGDSD